MNLKSLFVVVDKSTPAVAKPKADEATIAAILAETAGTSRMRQAPDFAAPASPMAPVTVVTPIGADGSIDVGAVFSQAGLTSACLDPFFKASNLINKLPSGQAPEVAREFVKSALVAFGVPLDSIQSSGSAMVSAVESFRSKLDADLASTERSGQERIAVLQKEIDEINGLLRSERQANVDQVEFLRKKHSEVLGVLSFLGLPNGQANGQPKGGK